MTQNPQQYCQQQQNFYAEDVSEDYNNAFYSENEAYEDESGYNYDKSYENTQAEYLAQTTGQQKYQKYMNGCNYYAYPQEYYYSQQKQCAIPQQYYHTISHRTRVPKAQVPNNEYHHQNHLQQHKQNYRPLTMPTHRLTSSTNNTTNVYHTSNNQDLGTCTNVNHQQFMYYEGQQLKSGGEIRAAGGSGRSNKRPVTAKTPKFYKPTAINSIRKKTSALCLPVASQPDPSCVKRQRKPALSCPGRRQDGYTSHLENLATSPGIEFEDFTDTNFLPDDDTKSSEHQMHKMHSEGDMVAIDQANNFEDMLNELEEKAHCNMDDPKKKKKLAKIVKYFNPRVPASIKARQEKLKSESNNCEVSDNRSNQTAAATASCGKSLQKSSVATMSLEKLLNQLQKCEPASQEILDESRPDSRLDSEGRRTDADVKPHDEKSDGESDKGDHLQNDEETVPKEKSFNYDNISRKLSSTQDSVSSSKNILDITKRISTSVVSKRSSKLSSRTAPLDDTGAMELHRSKSYIVDLIDRALSKELGTVPDRSSRQEFQNMTPKKAVNIVNKHSSHHSQKELCYEITAALTDSIISAATAPEAGSSSKEEPCRYCKSNSSIGDAYIKQLRQLRWGHIKHIQHEVKKLEDLETFLECMCDDKSM